MPVTYEIDKAKRMIHTKCSGAVTLEEVIDHFRLLEKDPHCPHHPDVLLDVTEQTSIPLSENLRDVAREIRRIRGTIQFGACAIVAGAGVLFGMLRMFEVFTEPYFRQTRVFRTAPEAEAWLVSQDPTTSAAD